MYLPTGGEVAVIMVGCIKVRDGITGAMVVPDAGT
jgi:hypothetical protein